MNNDAILANISKIHAYRYAKEKQRGVLTTNGGFSIEDPTLLQVPCTIQCVFSLDKLSDTDHTIFSTTLDNKGAKINYRFDRKRLPITLQENFYNIENISLDHIYNIVFTSDSNISKAYVDGVEVLSIDMPITNTVYLIGWNFYNVYGNCNYLLYRHFNYAMSADEVKTLYNGGKPDSYILPSVMKEMPTIGFTTDNTYTWTGEGTYFRVGLNKKFNGTKPVLVNVSISNYEEGVPWLYTGLRDFTYLPQGNGTYNVVLYINGSAPQVFMYGNTDSAPKKLTMTINSVTPLGCIAEYLAQNIVADPSDTNSATGWLDSAKQIPVNDSSLLPLEKSIGGYDMTASNKPQIIYK